MKKLNLTNLMNRLNRRGSGASLNLFRYAAMVAVLLMLGIGNAWAGGGSSNYYASLQINQSGPTGAGAVYVANSNTKPGTANPGTAVKSAATTTKNGNVTMYWWVDINPGYNVSLSGKVSGGPYSAASASGNVSCAASGTANGTQAYTATATFVAVTVNSVDAASKDLAPTNPSIDYPFTVTFETSNLKTIALDLNKSPETADGKFTITSWAQDGNNVVATGKFNGGDSYGGASRNNSTTVSLQSKASGSAAKTCTVTANFPAMAFVSVEADDVFATQGESGKTGSATFKYNYAAEDDFPTTPTLVPTSGTGAFTVTGYTVTPDFAKGETTVTVNYSFDTNNGIGDTPATLTLTAANGDVRTVTVTGHSEAMATNDASVTTTANVTTEYATFAQALAAANATSGATLTLLRNVDLGTITATNNITKAMTIDLNGKELRAAVNATSVGILTITQAVSVTIKDSKTGGKIINEIARNSEIRTIFVNKAGATLTLESGTIAVNNLGQYASAANSTLGVAKYASCAARAIHQIAGATVNINGGRVEAIGTREVYGIVQASSAATNAAGTSVLNITGGEIYAEAPYSAYGICASGKVNMSAGVINTHINTNMVNAYYAADNANNTSNGNGYGIYMQVSVSATASSCYYGTLNMTGGTVNVISDRTKAASLYNYGIHLNAAATGVGAGKTATDGTLSQKACAKASIENATINVHSGTYYSYGINVLGSYNSYDNTYFTVPIKNSTIDVKAYTYTYGVVANCGINSTYGGKYWGDVELTGNTLTAESVTGSTAYGVYVVATTAHIFKDANTTTAPIYFGEYATAAKAVINSGTYTAKTKTSSAYAVCSSTRAKTVYDSESTVIANRKPGGNAEAYPIVIIHGGTFRGETTTSTSRAVSSGGYTTIDGGTFEAFSTTTTAYGLYAVSGKLTASGVTISASATEKAYGALADCAVPSGNTAQTGFAYAAEMELNNCDITATTRTSTEARGVFVNATNKMHTWAGFIADSTSYTSSWAANKNNYAAYYRRVFPCTVAGRDSVGIAIAAKATINGCDIKATAATTTAYGVYSTATSVPASADSVASPIVNIKNSKFTVKTDGTTSAYGMYAGGPTTIDGCDFTVQPKTSTAYGVYTYDKKTTITNTKFDVKGTATVYGLYANAAIGSTTGWDYHGEFELGEGNDLIAAATGGNTSHVLTLFATKRGITTGKFVGNYANAASAHITGGKYKATATGTTSYVLNLSDQQVQGDVISRPTCTIDDGKFWALASGGTTGICSANGQIGHIVFKGGFYNVNTNLAKYKEEGKNVNDVLAGTPEYTEGYRYKVTSELSGAAVCKVYQSSTLKAEYATLEEALQYVNANTGTALTIVMIADYTLKKGDYLLPSNATLVVPNDLTRKSAIGNTPTRQNVNTPAPVQLVMLTFEAGVNMTVKGTIETSAVNTAANGGSAITGAPTGNFGRLHMVAGSTMTLESGANLNCWGYTTGKGEINALNGSTVREGFQLGYWRGGTATSSMLNNRNTWHAFPVTEYFVQNVEAPITFRPGAQLFGYSGVNVSIVGIQAANDVKLVGTSASMFLMEEKDASEDTYVRKEYDPETDRAIWTVNSGAKIGSFSFSLAGNTVNSADYYLPISNNMTIYVNEGEFTVTQDALLIPGAQVIISKLGKLTVASGKRLFVMDNEDWPGFLKSGTTTVSRWYYNALYSPSWTTNPRTLKYPPTTTRLPDGEIFVHGETEGSYYTSTSGANIHSTNDDAGKVKFVANAGADNSIQHVVNTDNERVTINFTTAQLKNETPETPYTSSKNTVAGEAFVYMEQQWVKVTDGCLTTRTDGSGTHEYAKPSDVVEVVSNGDNAYRDKATNSRYFINAEKALSNDQCVWWEVEPVTSGTYAGDYMANQEKYDNYGAYYYWDGSAGYWKPRYVTVTWKNQDGTTLATYTNVMCNTSPKYLSASPTWANTSIEKHDWVGWRDADGNIYDKNAVLPVAQGNVTYTAYYNVSKYEYTIKFVNPDKTVIWAGLVEAGTIPECPVEPTQAPTASTVYTFTGWNTTPVAVTGAATYTAVYSNATRQYHVTFYNYDAQSVLYEADVDYNTRPVYGGVTPFRANTSSFSYEWTGWQQGANNYGKTDNLAIVTGNVNYIATFSQTDLKYQVFFKRQDGSIIDAPLFNYEETPAAFPANPTLASTVSTDYTFDHWKPAELVPVTEEGKVYTAYFSESPHQYTAHFVNYDGKTLNVDQTIDYNTVPEYTGATPFKPNDSRNSFEFSGWAWEAGADWEAGSIAAGEAFPAIKGDITFTAQFTETLLQFNVRYIREDGTPLKEEKLKWGQSTTGFPSPVASYEDDTYSYTFNHWDPATVVNPVTTDATYTAYFNPAIKTYTITYDKGTNGTGSIDAGEKTHGVTFTLSNSKFTRTGYTQTGWSTTDGGAKAYELGGSYTANAAITLYPFWTVNTHTLTWNWYGGSTTSTTHTAAGSVVYGTTITYPADNSMTRENFVFNGWSIENATMPDENLTITALWTPAVVSVTAGGMTTYYTTLSAAFTAAKAKTNPTIKVLQDVSLGATSLTYDGANTCTLDLNGHTISGTGTRLLIIDNASATFKVTDLGSKPGKLSLSTSSTSEAPFCVYVKNGNLQLEAGTIYTNSSAKNAGGVRTQTSGSSTFTMNGGTVHVETGAGLTGYGVQTLGTAIINNGTVLVEASAIGYALWVQSTGATVTVENGKFNVTGANAYASNAIAPNAALQLKGGYYSTKTMDNSATVDSKYVATNYHVFALTSGAEYDEGYRYKVAEAYTVTFNANGHGTAPASQLIEKGQKATQPTAPTATGYTFGGWYKEAGCTNVWNFNTEVVTAATPLYAKWTPISYTITYNNLEGASNNNPANYNIESANIALANPGSRAGYDFAGWYTNEGLTTPAATPAITTGTTGNKTFYAKWTLKTYTITYNKGANGTGTIDAGVKTHGVTFTLSSDKFTRTGYTQTGWSTTDGGAKAYDLGGTYTANEAIELYPFWTINSHALTWNWNGGSTTSTTHTTGSVAYGMSIVYPEASTMTKENFVFNGWSIENATMPDDVLTIAAQWTPAVASVTAGGTTYYATLDDAIDAANSASNAVVTMLQGVTVTSQIELNAAMTIDLNGKTITSTIATATTGTFYINASGKTVTICDNGTGGKIYQEVSCSGFLYGIHLTKGSLAIESGTIHIKNTANNRAYGIYTDGSASSITVSGSATIKAESSASPFGLYSSAGNSLTMNGGTFIANGSGSRGIYMKGNTNLTNATITVTGSTKAYAIFAVSGNMTINSGTYTTSGANNNLCIYHRNGSITINGGYFSTSNKLYEREDGKTGTITLQGGYYNNDTELEEKCADNYHVLPLDDATYQYKVAEAYTLTWNLNGGSVQTAGTTAGLVEYGTDLTAPTVTKTGYTFKEWSPAVDQTMPESDATYTATWTAKTDTKYTVKHYKQNVAGDGYDLAETDVLSGTTASEVTPARKSYQGFDAPAAQTVTILADGSRVVTYNYTRKSYTLAWDLDGGIVKSAGTSAGSVKYGATLTAPVVTKVGYTFAGWSPSVDATMPAANTTYTATWTINQYTLTVAANNDAWGTVTGGGDYDYNTAHTITATPKPGFKFVEWNDHITSASRSVTVTADVTYTATFDYDIASYTVKHWQQNINDNDYTEVEADRQTDMSGTIGTATAAVANTYIGFTLKSPIEQQTIALENTVVNIYYDRETYTIIWDVKLSGVQEAYREDVLRYGATPSYGPDPTKESTTCCVYTFSGWQQPIVTVTANATYTGSFHVAAHPYTITFVNDNGEVLQSSEVGYASMPSYTGSEPVSSHTNSGDGYTYDFIGWKPAVAEVEGDATYTAIYSRYIGSITVTEPETITDNTTTVTTVVEDGGALTVGTEGDEVILESTTIIVEAGGDLNVDAAGTIAADVFIIQATTEEQGDEDAREEVQISGELSETGTKNLTAIYYDLTRKHGNENFLARVWYAVAVPWAVEVPTYSNGGVYIKRGDEYIQQRLGATFDILSYDGACRAQNGAGANCWVYLENEIAAGADPVMVPGKLYMIFLTEETSTIRFKKKAGESIHTNSLTVTPHEAANGNDANWNGIANPATYRAYLNVESSGLVQKFVPGTQPRQGGSYLPLDLSDKQAVGQPLFIQVNPDADEVLATPTNPSAAPRRVQEENEQQARYAIGIAANGRLADRLYIQTAEEKEEGFEVGKDMSKMSVSTYVAQMWVNRYDSKLCLNTVPWKRNKADFPLGIYAPQAGEYKIFAPADIASGDNLYLTVDGRAIWNLTYAPYYVSLEKGTTTRYGLRLVRSNTPAVSTGVENTQAEAYPTAQKYLIDDVVYILREGEVYTITGQKAK